MKKFIKNNILGFIIGSIIFGSIGVLAASQILASDISYKDGTVESALNDLYTKADNQTMEGTVCMLVSGTKNTVGAKYACNPGDGVIRNFYILSVGQNNVKLIMEKNIAERVTYATSRDYFTTGAGVSTKTAWTNVQSVDVPNAQDIVDASLVINPKQNFTFNISEESATWWCLGSHEQDQPSGPTYCPTSTSQQKASWLFDYTIDCGSRGCSNSLADNSNSYGYWTKDEIYDDSTRAWDVNRLGDLDSDAVSNANSGVRPVITVAKNKLAN